VELLGLQTPDRQVFERGVGGRRYLNLTGAADALAAGKLQVRGVFAGSTASRRCGVSVSRIIASNV